MGFPVFHLKIPSFRLWHYHMYATIYKVFSKIISERLNTWIELENKIDESQAGFRAEYSAVDNIFVLQSLTRKYLSKPGGRFYCLYVDFKKAFDTINHNKLLGCLVRHGIKGKIVNVFKSMYKQLKSCVRTEHGLTDFFTCNIGIRQGDISSLKLFSLYINDLCQLLRERCGSGIFVTNEISQIFCMYDVANVAETAIKLQRQLNTVDEFFQIKGMQVNLNKTEIIVFRIGGYLRVYEHCLFRGESIRTTSVYKHMGILFTPKLSWSSAKYKLSCH